MQAAAEQAEAAQEHAAAQRAADQLAAAQARSGRGGGERAKAQREAQAKAKAKAAEEQTARRRWPKRRPRRPLRPRPQAAATQADLQRSIAAEERLDAARASGALSSWAAADPGAHPARVDPAAFGAFGTGLHPLRDAGTGWRGRRT